MKRAIVSIVVGAFASAAGAQWAQEPTSVMGVELGAPASSLPKCPPGYGALSSKTVCLEASQFEPKIGTLWGLPLNFILGGGSAFLVDGRIAQVSILVRHDESYRHLKEMLVERYGPPHKSQVMTVTSNAGAVASSEVSTWSGKAVQITYLERSDRIDRSQAVFSYLPLAQTQAQERRQDAKRDASKL